MAQSTPSGLVCRHWTRVAYHVGDEGGEEDKGEQGLDTGRGPCIAYSASRHPLQHTCAAACRGDVTPPGATRTRASAGPASDTQTRTSSEFLHPSPFIRVPSSECLHPSLWRHLSPWVTGQMSAHSGGAWGMCRRRTPARQRRRDRQGGGIYCAWGMCRRHAPARACAPLPHMCRAHPGDEGAQAPPTTRAAGESHPLPARHIERDTDGGTDGGRRSGPVRGGHMPHPRLRAWRGHVTPHSQGQGDLARYSPEPGRLARPPGVTRCSSLTASPP